MMKETERSTMSGIAMLLVLFALIAGSAAGMYYGLREGIAGLFPLGLLVMIASIAALAGFFTVGPNQAMVVQLFGQYKGSVRGPGLHWANPFFSKKRVSLRVRNFETQHLKVNDLDGNPIEIAAVVVWYVRDSAEAVFEVDNYEHYVTVQSESALRNMATAYPYDAHNENQMSLRSATGEIAAHLKREIEDRLAKAGVEVTEARITHLAYSPEIATAMLQRQQASAIVAARTKIVEGAVGMVEMALEKLSEKNIVILDQERKAQMVSNLLVVLCGERGAQPVVNTGTIYH